MKRVNKITIQCEECNKDYQVLPCHLDRLYCSTQCRVLALRHRVYTPEHRRRISEAARSKKNNFWKDGRTKIDGYFEHANRIKKVKIKRPDLKDHYTLQEWLDLREKYNGICPRCLRSEPEIKLGVDHIVPLSRGGDNTINNIQALCPNCNVRKYTKVIRYELPREVKL